MHTVYIKYVTAQLNEIVNISLYMLKLTSVTFELNSLPPNKEVNVSHTFLFVSAVSGLTPVCLHAKRSRATVTAWLGRLAGLLSLSQCTSTGWKSIY